MSKFITYKKFQNANQLYEIAELLKQNSILFEIEDNTTRVSQFIIGQDYEDNIAIKISPDDFITVNKLLEDNATELINNLNEDYYLYKFSNDELMQIVVEPDKWGEIDQKLSVKLLNNRGVTVTKELLKTLEQKRFKELSAQETASNLWIIAGYISSLLGGLLGIGIGMSLCTTKRTLPNGDSVYVYIDKDRSDGRNMMIIGAIMFMVSLWFYA
ncbi:MAG: hypothetical protein ABL940_06000 [Bacteroidia bacterium]